MLPIYHNEILKLVHLGFIEEVEPNLVTGNPSYMPHRPVIWSGKATSKVRPVFDGSAKTGPNLNPDLLGVLLRFRMFRVAWIADVEQAFLNAQLTEEEIEYASIPVNPKPRKPRNSSQQMEKLTIWTEL